MLISKKLLIATCLFWDSSALIYVPSRREAKGLGFHTLPLRISSIGYAKSEPVLHQLEPTS